MSSPSRDEQQSGASSFFISEGINHPKTITCTVKPNRKCRSGASVGLEPDRPRFRCICLVSRGENPIF
eukprot:scaffold18525_cov14-Tisochrysis_lutea.AAC.1